MAVKTLEFTVKNSKSFSAYLKKFNSISNTVLFEVDGLDESFISKSPNEERSIVKFGKSSFSESEFTPAKKFTYRIKIGVYNISRLIKIIEQFGTEFQFILKYDEIVGDKEEKDFGAISILLKNDDLKFNAECTSLNIFKYISDDLWANTISKIDSLVSFDFTKENIEKVNALCELDKEYKFIEFINKGGSLYAKGKSFEYLVAPTSNVDAKITFYKDQFYKVDVENCSVQMGADRMLFTSLDTETATVISMVEKDDNYDDKDEDPFI